MDVLDLVGQDKKFIVLKHDVETNPQKALTLAKIEHNHNIQATYYVQSYLLKDDGNIKILQEISNLGHEVTYHYDVLDNNRGDWQKAIKEFEDTVRMFEGYGFKVNTVCPHGNPVMNRKGWASNKDFFRNQELSKKYDNIVDVVINFPQKSGKQYLYISDAGYGWKLISDIANNDKTGTKPDINLKGFDEIIKLINKSNSVIISTHPHRWHRYSVVARFRIFLFIVLRITVRLFMKVPFIKFFFGKFFYLAKKI
jgi:hypothetical protein